MLRKKNILTVALVNVVGRVEPTTFGNSEWRELRRYSSNPTANNGPDFVSSSSLAFDSCAPPEQDDMNDTASVRRGQEYLLQSSTETLVDWVTNYLRATVNPRLVSIEEEIVIFPVLSQRLNELHVDQLLDIVECNWARSTLLRFGTDLKDTIRNRIADIAKVAIKCLQDADTQNSEELYIDEKTEREALMQEDVILAEAVQEMSADTVLRCITVIGMSAGRRKRDLHFFEAMGRFLIYHINSYKDPHDLVRVLTAFSRAKIVPPPSFLATLGRRFPILNKKVPLEPLPSYRGMANFSRMGYETITPYRFFADCMFMRMEEKLSQEYILRTTGGNLTEDAAKHTSDSSRNQTSADKEKETQRLRSITGLKPSMFSRWLFILARYGAPHQQYLRPLVGSIVVPMLPHLPPPSFTRLLAAVHLFNSTDAELISPIIAFVCEDLFPNGNLSHVDALLLLSILSKPDVQPIASIPRFFKVLCDLFGGGADASSPKGQYLLQPRDMCAITSKLLAIQRNTDIPLETTTPLIILTEKFAGRFQSLLELRVVSLTHLDIFLDICTQMLHPDNSGAIATLKNMRSSIDQKGGEDFYYAALDIDIRDMFHQIASVNKTNTFNGYRPLPGVLQVDLRAAMAAASVTDLLEAVDLHERVYPGMLAAPVRQLVGRSVIAKLGESEEVVTADNTIEMRTPAEVHFTREDLTRFKALVERTPLVRVRTSRTVWSLILTKAQRLGMTVLEQEALTVLEDLS